MPRNDFSVLDAAGKFASRAHRRAGCIARNGFTLIEMLVVIAVMAILVALLLPAVQQAREAARRTVCKNNLAEIGIALQNYHDAYSVLPPGSLNDTGPIVSVPQGYHFGWYVSLLPFIDERTVADHFDFAQSVYAVDNLPPRKTQIELLLCPSDPGPRELDGIVLANYAGCHHEAAAPIDITNHGMLFLNSRVRYADVSDGLTNTLIVGEILRQPGLLGWASGTRATLRNAGTLLNTGPGASAYYNDLKEVAAFSDPLFVGGFASTHQGGAQFVLADSSVRFLGENIDPGIYELLAARGDGEMVGEF